MCTRFDHTCNRGEWFCYLSQNWWFDNAKIVLYVALSYITCLCGQDLILVGQWKLPLFMCGLSWQIFLATRYTFALLLTMYVLFVCVGLYKGLLLSIT